MALEGQLLGRYRLLQLLGTGGMGEVYLASDTLINRQVAIKVIRSEVSAYPDAGVAQESAPFPAGDEGYCDARSSPHHAII